MTETLEFTTPEDEIEVLPETMAELRSEMYEKIDYASSLGVFTLGEAAEWRNGFEACTQIEHMEGLIEVIDDFIDSGWMVVSQIEEMMMTEELSEADKDSFLAQLDLMSYEEKGELLQSLQQTLQEVSRKRAQLKLILIKNQIARPEAALLEQEFIQASLDNKTEILHKAEKMTVATENRQDGKMSVRESIELQLQAGNLAEARQLLEKNFPAGLSYAQYARLDFEINQREINSGRRDVTRAYKLAA